MIVGALLRLLRRPKEPQQCAGLLLVRNAPAHSRIVAQLVRALGRRFESCQSVKEPVRDRRELRAKGYDAATMAAGQAIRTHGGVDAHRIAITSETGREVSPALIMPLSQLPVMRGASPGLAVADLIYSICKKQSLICQSEWRYICMTHRVRLPTYHIAFSSGVMFFFLF